MTVQQRLPHCPPLYAVACCSPPTVPPGPHHALVRAAQHRDSHSTMQRVAVSKDLCDVLEYSRHDREATVQQPLSHCTPPHTGACCSRPTVPPGPHHTLV